MTDQVKTGGGAVDVIEQYWKIDEPNYYRNVGTDNSEYIKLYQQGGFTPSDSPAQQDWTFRMSDLNSYYLMAQSFFQFDFSLNDGGVGDVTTKNLIYPSDMRCLFKSVQLDLNSVAVEANNQNYWMFANVDRAFQSRQWVETAGSLGGQFLTDTRFDNPAYLGPYANQDFALTNDVLGAPADATALKAQIGYDGDYARLQTYAKKRALLSFKAASNTSSRCNLRVDMPSIFQFYRYWTRVHKGIDVQCRFTTVGDGGFITNRRRVDVGGTGARAAGDYSMKWEGSGLTWWCKTLKPSPRVEIKLNSMLQRGQEIMCPFESVKCYNFTPTNGSSSFRIVNESSRPTRMIVAFQRKSVLTTTDDISVLQMPEGMTTMSASVNGKKVPNIDIQMVCPTTLPHQGYVVDGGTGKKVNQQSSFDLSEPYMRYLLLTGTYNSAFKSNFSRGSGSLSYVDWVSTSPFVSFDLSNNAIGDISGSNSEITLNYNVANDDITDYIMYAILYTERTVSLNLAEASTYIAIR